MDEELKELGALALRNAFWHSFSALVNDTLKASEGLIDREDQLRMLGDLTSVYGRGNASPNPSVAYPKIVSFTNRGQPIKAHARIADALQLAEAATIRVNSEVVFARDEGEGEWMWKGS